MKMRDKVLRYIEAFMDENGYGPTYREIARACGISATTAWYHVQRLEAAGRLRLDGRRKIRLEA